MDVMALQQLFGTLGMSGIFLYACWYLIRRAEEREKERAMESIKREERIVHFLTESEAFIRTSMRECIDRQTDATNRHAEAMNNVANAMANMPCRTFRKEDIERLIAEAKQEIKESDL